MEAELEVVDSAELELDAPDGDNMMEFLSELFYQCYVQASGHSVISLYVEEQEQKRRQEKTDIFCFLGVAGSSPPACMPSGL